MMDKNNITGIILSGGKSRRMGTDKGFLSFNGKLFTQASIDSLKPLVSEIIIVSNNADYDVFGLKRIEDIMDNAGPLAGIYSGLNHSKTECIIALSCDIPLITSGILKRLIEGTDDASEVIQIESNGKSMPLIALYKKSCKDVFYKLLQKGERRLQFAVNQCQVKNITLDSESARLTMNINTPEELKVIENEHKH